MSGSGGYATSKDEERDNWFRFIVMYVPSNGADFDNWFRFIVEYVVGRTGDGEPMWPHLPPASVAGLEAAYADWNSRGEPKPAAQGGHKA